MAATRKPSAAAEKADKFLREAKAEGFRVMLPQVGVVTIRTDFRPGDNDAYVRADMTAYGVLSLLGARGGSTWGTDGGSVGGYIGLRDGYYKLNVSGVPQRVWEALAKKLV
jgi:hypothetical protein